jgi:hypothetical protein
MYRHGGYRLRWFSSQTTHDAAVRATVIARD